MNVALTVPFDETLRRRVRAAEGRGGLATRAECRIWMHRALAAAEKSLPAPKVRAKRPTVEKPDRLAVASAPETPCRFCGKPKEDHGRLMLSCLPPHRTKFSPRWA